MSPFRAARLAVSRPRATGLTLNLAGGFLPNFFGKREFSRDHLANLPGTFTKKTQHEGQRPAGAMLTFNEGKTELF